MMLCPFRLLSPALKLFFYRLYCLDIAMLLVGLKERDCISQVLIVKAQLCWPQFKWCHADLWGRDLHARQQGAGTHFGGRYLVLPSNAFGRPGKLPRTIALQGKFSLQCR
jgi:hypothetical protein